MSAFVAAQYATGSLITATMHPFGYAKVLMQIGHEPLAPISSVSLFGRKSLIYPNVFQYMSHIKKTDGFFGLYRGVVPRILSGAIGSFVQNVVLEKIKDDMPLAEVLVEDDLIEWVKLFCKQTSQETVSRCLGIVVSHPFHVIMMRCMVQFVGKETKYNSIFSSVGEVYRNDGILGFFSGMVPRLVGEILTVWISSFIAQMVNKYLIQDKEMKSYVSHGCGLLVTHITYPFTLVTNIMAVNSSGLAAVGSIQYTGWTHCLSHLKSTGQAKRGSNMFWRYYLGSAVLE